MSGIQSEMEVRSKFIVPLIEYLGYPSMLRSEEFPVYGWQGRSKNPTKNADFLLFSDKDFATHRFCKPDSIKWVQDHSLLIIEAKKPGEMPDIDGQAVYYTQWTKALAYIACDGEEIRGSYYSETTADREYINCKMEDIEGNPFLEKFSYETLSLLKQGLKDDNTELTLDSDIKMISNENIQEFLNEEIDIPKSTLEYMANALSVNSDEISNYELVRRFLRVADTILDCDLRYDIPAFAFDMPREIVDAKVYVNKNVYPLFSGQVELYYWNDFDRLCFRNEYIEIIMVFQKGVPIQMAMGYAVLDRQAAQRLAHLHEVRKCYLAKSIMVELEDERSYTFDFEKKQYEITEQLQSDAEFTKFWIDEISKIIEIESVYEIEFNLKKIDGMDNINKLYDAVDIIYDGINGNCNCTITIPIDALEEEPIEIDEPVFFEERDLPLPDKYIHDICFRPCASMILPGIIDKKNAVDGIVHVDACCAYRIVE